LPQALNSRITLRQPNGEFEITASPTAKSGNWLALTQSGDFRLVLTLFDTPTAGSSGLIDLAMPLIEKIGCGP
jgi:hypothetical protein